MDDLDRRLLTLLQADARQSHADLARQLGVARSTVVVRLARLQRDGVVVGFTVRLAGLEPDAGVQACVSLVVQARHARTVQLRLSSMPELRQLCSVSGEFDYLAWLHAPSPARLDVLLDEIGEMDGVVRTQTSVVLAVRIDRRT